MTKPSMAYRTMGTVCCPTCGRALPKISRQPINQDLALVWDEMIYIERRLVAACLLDHRRQAFREWRPMFMAEYGNMRYRQVQNALRRLVPCRWVERVSRGLYRISLHAVESMAWVPPRCTITKLVGTAQDKGTEDT